MPNPKTLKVGDLVRFVSLPDEWSNPDYQVPDEDLAFMKAMIKRTWPSRVCKIDEHGYPWIWARMREKDEWIHHGWMISEASGWRLVGKKTS